MPRSRSTGWHKRAAAILAAAIACLVSFPAAAHAEGSLISSDPRPGSALSAAPHEVRLAFTDRISGVDSHVGVSTAAGDDLADGDLEQSAPDEVRLKIRTATPGDMTVAYHVIFADGTSSTGAYRFSMGTGRPPQALTSQAQAALGSAISQHVHQVDGLGATLLVIDGAVLLVVVLLLIVRPRPGGKSTERAWRYRG